MPQLDCRSLYKLWKLTLCNSLATTRLRLLAHSHVQPLWSASLILWSFRFKALTLRCTISESSSSFDKLPLPLCRGLHPRLRLAKLGKALRAPRCDELVALCPRSNLVTPGKRWTAFNPGGNTGYCSLRIAMLVTPSSNPSCQVLLTPRMFFISSMPPALATSASTSGGRPLSQSTAGDSIGREMRIKTAQGNIPTIRSIAADFKNNAGNIVSRNWLKPLSFNCT